MTAYADQPPGRIAHVFDVPNVVRGWVITPPVLTWVAKDPSETCRRDLDFSGVITGCNIVDVSLSASGLIVAARTWADGVVTVFILGGVAGTSGTVTARIYLDDGTNRAATVVQPVFAATGTTPLDISAPLFVTRNGELVTFRGAPVLCGRAYPPATITLGGGPLTLAGAPFSLGPT